VASSPCESEDGQLRKPSTRLARLRDDRRLASGEVTPTQLQDENSLVPMSATITILNLRETLERYYGK
jgi:hypothetical protein